MATLEKTVEKIGRLLALAEGTSSESEAASAMSRAQALASAHSISVAVANQNRQENKVEVPTHQRVRIGESRRHINAFLIELYDAVGRAQGCKITIQRDNLAVNVFGMPSDVEITNQIYISLATQMQTFVAAYLKQGDWRSELVWREKTVTSEFGWKDKIYGQYPTTMQSARSTFQETFVWQVSKRLKDAAAEAVAEAKRAETHFHHSDAPGSATGAQEASGVELALVSKKDEVEAHYKTHSNARGSWSRSRGGSHSSGAASAGRAAGNRANLGGHASVGGGRGRINA